MILTHISPSTVNYMQLRPMMGRPRRKTSLTSRRGARGGLSQKCWILFEIQASATQKSNLGSPLPLWCSEKNQIKIRIRKHGWPKIQTKSHSVQHAASASLTKIRFSEKKIRIWAKKSDFFWLGTPKIRFCWPPQKCYQKKIHSSWVFCGAFSKKSDCGQIFCNHC